MSNRDRKVRGERIRQSRNEKQTTETTTRNSPDGSAPRWDDVFDEDTFVETEATADVSERVERWLSAGRPVHLVGPTGCGKTALATRTARDRGRPVVFINGDEQLTTADLVGEYAETERESVRDRYVHNVMKSKDIVSDRWVDNPLTVAVREGATLVYNEFARSKPAANNVLLSVFEEGVLELPGKRGEDRYVEVHPEFRAILTSNTVEYAGVHTPQDALLDRLIGIHMDFYDRETEMAIVAEQVPSLSEATVGRIVDTVRTLRADDAIEATVGTRTMIMAGEGIAVVGEPTDDEFLVEVVTDALSSKVADRDRLTQFEERIEAAVAGTGA